MCSRKGIPVSRTELAFPSKSNDTVIWVSFVSRVTEAFLGIMFVLLLDDGNMFVPFSPDTLTVRVMFGKFT